MIETFKTQYPYFSGQRIYVRFGGFGKQLAEVIEDCGRKWACARARYDYVRVKKYRANSNKWTNVVRVPRTEILGLVP